MEKNLHDPLFTSTFYYLYGENALENMFPINFNKLEVFAELFVE